ncbi:hypothetical protein O3M35_008257 [Rhynocoris fuscipes]|uniref:Spaetzle domain-containing protein n=1 Tax=Rhynocoris fuscipes TaxID=488301 RepID=A0AAW1D739_9HEMI
MGYYPEFLGLLILVSSVNLMPTKEAGTDVIGSRIGYRKGRRLYSDAWNEPRNYSRSTSSEGTEIIFPDDDRPILVDKFVPPFGKKPPECAKGSTFCENVDHYPSQYIENVLQETGIQFKGMFGNDIVRDYTSLLHRIDVKEEHTLCPSVENVVYPKTAKNKEDQWLFVVNQGQYRQGVRVETCKSPDNSESCAFTEGFPLGYKTTCRQKYIYRRLIALNADGKTITDTFQLPSCCACIVTNDALRNRSGNYARSQSNVTNVN